MLLTLSLALALRLWGVAWQLPFQLHPDEGHYVWKAVDMVRDGNLNPKYFRNPSFYTYVLFGQFKLLDALGLAPDGGPWPDWELLRPPSVYALLGRLTTALLGVANVLAVYHLGAVLLGRLTGLVGALLLAVCLLHVRDSHFATNDVPATLLLTLSVLCSALLARGGQRTANGAPPAGRLRALLLAGLFGGLATSTKYNAGFFVGPLVVGYLAAHGRRAVAPRPVLGLIAAGVVSLLAYFVGTPFTVLAWPTFLADFRVQQRFSRDGWEGQGPEPVGGLYLDALAQGMGSLALGAAVLGFVLLLTRRRFVAAGLLGTYPLLYVGFMLGVKLFFVRFADTLVPFLCLAAGYAIVQASGVERLTGRLRQTMLAIGRAPHLAAMQVLAFDTATLRKHLVVRGAVLGLMVVAIMAEPTWNSARHNMLIQRTDTRVLAYRWLEENLPLGSKVLADDYSVRDRRPRAYLPDRGRFDLDVVNAVGERDLAAWRQQGYQYVVTSSFQAQRFPGRLDAYGALEREAERVATFSPTAVDGELPFSIEDLYSPFHDLDRYERPGPTIRVYALR